MAALRALGTSIENSGIDDAWIEADVYDSATTRQILKCAHYKRTLHAHIQTYMALYELLLEKFFAEKPNLKCICSKPVNEQSRKPVEDQQLTEVLVQNASLMPMTACFRPSLTKMLWSS